MAKRINNIEGQSLLFLIEGETKDPALHTWQDMENDPAIRLQALVGDNIGPHVVIEARAEALVLAMNALAHRNMLQGFDAASHAREHKKPIWERYLDGTPRVIDYSQSKVERLQTEAEDHFARATGFITLKGTRMLMTGEVRSRMDTWWRDFHGSYGYPKHHDDLDKFRKAQKAILPKDHPLRVKKKRKAKTLEERAA